MYTVKKGDTLWAISGRFYGDSIQIGGVFGMPIKLAMIKRSKRNIKQPGHWIFPGQRLK
ncbi:LysM peptidoglycan-binding domain-containing protein [Bacillus pumilus]|nr:LysM peptidoglycan-binding domain-containing protein [Bacillus pumilus]